jgi:hypothetical protein
MACSCCCLMAAAVAGCVQHPHNPKMVFFNTTKPLERSCVSDCKCVEHVIGLCQHIILD